MEINDSKQVDVSARLAAVVKWLEANQPDVFSRGLWDAVYEADRAAAEIAKASFEVNKQIADAFKAGFIEAAKWPHVCTQDADSRAVDEAARAYAATLRQQAERVDVSRDLLAIASQARNKESERARLTGEPRNETAELRAALEAAAPLLAGGVPDAIRADDERQFLGWSDPNVAYRAGWNQCRDAMLAARPSQPTDAQDGAS